LMKTASLYFENELDREIDQEACRS
jgi:hypothetical protein